MPKLSMQVPRVTKTKKGLNAEITSEGDAHLLTLATKASSTKSTYQEVRQ